MTSEIRGTIVALDMRRQAVTIRTGKGAIGTFKARITSVNEPEGKGPFSALRAGLPVQAKFDPDTEEILELEVAG